MEQIIKKLRDDKHYYGEFGKQYLSASDVGTLLTNPKAFKSDSEKTKAMIEGSYMHALILEPDTVDDRFEIVDCSSRGTKKYKEIALEVKDKDLLLKGEAENMEECANAILKNFEVYNLIRGNGTVVEEPAIKKLFGNWWKGKRDIGNEFTVDIKTTSDISKFRQSAYRYNYDSQAWVYKQLFDAPVIFVPVDKITHQVGIITCSDEFLDRGMQKVIQATDVYNKYFGDNATEDINNFLIRESL